MKHQSKKGRKFGRIKKVRRGFLKGLTVALIEKEKIITTQARAKELSRTVEPLVTKARAGSLAGRRLLARRLPPRAVKKLVDEIAPRYRSRTGGYTRITHLGVRRRDASPMAVIEFI